SASVGKRQRSDCAVEKIVHMPGGRTWVATDGKVIGTVNILVTLAGHEKSDAGAEDDVFSEQRSPLKADTAIESDIVAGVIGEKHLLGHRGISRPDVVDVHEAFQLRSDVGVQTITDDDRARIDEIGLAFRFAGAEVGHQTVALLKIHRCPTEIEPLVYEKAERPPEEKWPIKNGIESSRV